MTTRMHSTTSCCMPASRTSRRAGQPRLADLLLPPPLSISAQCTFPKQRPTQTNSKSPSLHRRPAGQGTVSGSPVRTSCGFCENFPLERGFFFFCLIQNIFYDPQIHIQFRLCGLGEEALFFDPSF